MSMTNPSYRIEVITSVQRRRCWRRSAWSRRPLNRRVHVKDMDSKGEIADVGSGKIDFARIFARSEKADIRHYFVEQDNSVSPIASIAPSTNFFDG